MAPLGILTAIIGAIRVAGPGYLRAVIGRARENRASAELDFMSSTSHEVSELWNGDGIVRTMGKGKVKQIIFLKGCEQSEDLGLYTLHIAERDGLMEYEPYHGPFVKELKSLWNMAPKPWKKIKIIGKQDNIDPNNINSNNKNHSNNELIDNDPREDKSEGNAFNRPQSKINDSGRAPNISLNLHPKQTTWELVAAAILGIILQVGVIIFSAFVAYNSRFGDIVGGRPSAYAFPILASGTAVLVFGMGICALVIGESTNEDIWKLKEHKDHTTEDAQGNHESASHTFKDVEAGGTGNTHKHRSLSQRLLEVFAKRPTRESGRKLEFAHKEIRVFWLQKSFIVSDQTFNSYMLMAREGKEFVLTSCRSNDPVFGDSSDSIPRARLDKFPQQESRSSSFTPHSSKLPQSDKLALSWLSTLCIIGTSTGVVGFVLQFEGFRGISWACSIAQLVAILIMTIVRAIIRRGMLDSPVAEKIQDGYEIDWLALRFGNKPDFLLNLSDRKSKDAVCFVCGKLKSHLPRDSPICTAPIWKVFERIVPPKNPSEGWVSKSPEGFTPSKNIPGVQRVVNVRNRLQTLTEWSNPTTKRNAESVAKAIESIIQLLHWTNDESHFIWFIEVQSNEGTPDTMTKVKLSANRENGQWMVSALDIESIISLWMYHLQNDRKSEYGVENDTGRKSHVIRSLQRILGPSTAILKRDLEWWAGAGVVEALDTFSWKAPASPEILSLGFGDKVYTTFTHIPIEKFLAQHIFSTFMWAIADLVQIASSGDKLSSQIDPPPEEEKLELDGPKPKWNILRLTHNTIKSMVKTVEATGLGSSEDAYLLIIPPLSYFYKLPNACVADLVRKKAQESKLEYRDTACARYKKLLAMCEIYSLDSMFVYSVVSTVVSFLVTTTSTSAPAQYLSYDNKQTSQRSREDLINTLRKDYAQFLFVLKQVYVKQDRVKSFDKALPLDKVSKQKQKIKLEEGYTSLHLKIINKDKVDVSNLDSFKDFFRVPDILGWTPLHYAVIYSSEFALALLKNTPALANKIDLADRTPLHYAVMKQHEERQTVTEEVIEELSNKTKPLPGRDGKFPLHWAVKTCNLGATKLLLKIKSHRDTISSKDCWDMTPLHFAALNGNLAIMRYLLEGTNHTPSVLNTTDCFDRTVLHAVVMRIGSEEFLDGSTIVKELLENGADVQRKDKDGKKALDLAAELELNLNTDVSKITNRQGVLNAEVRGEGCLDEKLCEPENKHFGLCKNSKGKELNLSIDFLLRKENLAVDGASLLLWAVKKDFKTPFNILIGSKIIMKGDIKLEDDTKRSILHLAVDLKSDTMVEKILEKWQPDNPESPVTKIKPRLQDTPPLDLRDVFGNTALMLASEKGYDSIVARLLKANPDKDLKNLFGRTALLLAVEKGHLDVVTKLLDHGASPDAKDLDGHTALMLAISQGTKAIVQKLMDAKAKRNIKDNNERPTFLAVKHGRYDIMKLFLEDGADPNEVNDNGDSILCVAIKKGHSKIVKLLLDSGAGIENTSGPNKQTPLSWAATMGNEEIIGLLLTQEAKLEAKDSNGWTPLIWALRGGHRGATQILIENNAVSNFTGKQSTEILVSAMIWACQIGDKDLFRLILDLGANINAQDSSGSTPLIEASKNGSTQIVEQILKNETFVDAQNRSKSTALFEAVAQGHEKIVQLLLDARANVNIANDAKETPLFLAVRNSQYDILKMLLEKKPNVNLANKENETPLSLALTYKNESIARSLLEAGANVNETNCKGGAPLLSAVRNENESMVSLLLETRWKANVDIMNDQKETPLALAVRNRNQALAEIILQANADVNIANDSGQIPLTAAVRLENIPLVKLLLEAGANVNEEDSEGETPLFRAVFAKNSEIVSLLLQHGAGTESYPTYGRTLFQEAVWWGNEEIVDSLLSYKTNISDRDMQGRDVFHTSAQLGLVSLFQKLAEQHCDGKDSFASLVGNSLDKQGRNVFHHAAVSGDTEMISYLLECPIKFQYDQPDKDGWTPLHWAAQDGDFEVVQRLIKEPIKEGARSVAESRESIKGWTPRQIANYNDKWKIVDLLESSSIPDEYLPEAGMEHGSICDGCSCWIYGIRYHCVVCKDFDFCEKCMYTSGKTHRDHNFEGIGRSNAESSSDPNSTHGNSKQEDADQGPIHNEATNAITTGNDTITPEDPVKEGMHHEDSTLKDTTEEKIDHGETPHDDVSADGDEFPNKDAESMVVEGSDN